MTASQLITDLARRGFSLAVREDRLICRPAADPETVSALIERKAEIMGLLTRETPALALRYRPDSPEGDRLEAAVTRLALAISRGTTGERSRARRLLDQGTDAEAAGDLPAVLRLTIQISDLAREIEARQGRGPKAGAMPEPEPGMGRQAGACPACHGSTFWESVPGVRVCALCHPPARPEIVTRWIEAEGGAGA